MPSFNMVVRTGPYVVEIVPLVVAELAIHPRLAKVAHKFVSIGDIGYLLLAISDLCVDVPLVVQSFASSMRCNKFCHALKSFSGRVKLKSQVEQLKLNDMWSSCSSMLI